MIKFGSNNVIVGYIKQLLSSFNLPMIDIYDENKRLAPNFNYIKNNKIYKAISSNELNPKSSHLYAFNKFIPNITSSFNNNSIVYDYDTHKYLGKYLRFLRDYKKINLMSLYNNFYNEFISNIDFNFIENSVEVLTEITDSRYKYYVFPISAGDEYTIAIDSPTSYEICCIFYDKAYYPSSLNFLETFTYQKINSSYFSKPVLYDKLTDDSFINILDEDQFKEYYRLKDKLCMIIKLPTSVDSSIVVLEGNHVSDNDFKLNSEGKVINNFSITNYDKTSDEELLNIPLKTPSQLLYINSGISYPFADKLIGYLLGNTISNLTEISDDVKRVQKKLAEIHDESLNISLVPNKNTDIPYGIWKNKYRNILYDYFRKANINNPNTSKDILGYCDKDVEKSLELFKSKGKDIKI